MLTTTQQHISAVNGRIVKSLANAPLWRCCECGLHIFGRRYRRTCQCSFRYRVKTLPPVGAVFTFKEELA